MMSNSESRKREAERAAGELVADVDTLAAAVVRIMLANTDATPRKLAEALVAAGFGSVDAARREALLSAADAYEPATEMQARGWVIGWLVDRAHQIGATS